MWRLDPTASSDHGAVGQNSQQIFVVRGFRDGLFRELILGSAGQPGQAPRRTICTTSEHIRFRATVVERLEHLDALGGVRSSQCLTCSA
jgi:hypothetical protein